MRGGELYSGGIAEVGSRGCGWRGRQRQDDEEKLRAGDVSEAPQRTVEPEGRKASTQEEKVPG